MHIAKFLPVLSDKFSLFTLYLTSKSPNFNAVKFIDLSDFYFSSCTYPQIINLFTILESF